MERSQYELCIEVLRRLDKAGVLENIVLVGSWCTLFYEGFFRSGRYRVSLRTRDVDLLIPYPAKMKVRTDVAQLLKDLGFVVGFTGSQGYIRLEHPELIVEFLVPERGRGFDRPYPLPQLGLNAQALRFLEFLSAHTIKTTVGSLRLTLPHPAAFALHKLLVLSRRASTDKQQRDRDAAVRILTALIEDGQTARIRDMFLSMPARWQSRIRKQLAALDDARILKTLDCD